MLAKLFLGLVICLCSCHFQAEAAVDAANTHLSSYDAVGAYNMPFNFVIQTYDELDMPLTQGGLANFSAQVSNGGTAGAIVDNGDGTYSGTWTAPSTGSYSLAITLETPPPSAQIEGSPYSVQAIDPSVSPSFSPSPSFSASPSLCSQGSASRAKTFAVGCGVSGTLFNPSCCVGSPATFTVYARDADGKYLCQGGDTLVATIKKPFQATPFATFTMTDNADGSYSGSYTPDVFGIWNVMIKLNGLNLNIVPYLPIFLVC